VEAPARLFVHFVAAAKAFQESREEIQQPMLQKETVSH